MLPFRRFQFSIAQLLVLMFLVAVVCGLGPHVSSALDLPPSGRGPRHPDGSRRQRDRLALSEERRCCVVLCDSRSGECLHYAELVGGAPDDIRISSDCWRLGRRVCRRQIGIRSRRLGRAPARGRVGLGPRTPRIRPWEDARGRGRAATEPVACRGRLASIPDFHPGWPQRAGTPCHSCADRH